MRIRRLTLLLALCAGCATTPPATSPPPLTPAQQELALAREAFAALKAIEIRGAPKAMTLTLKAAAAQRKVVVDAAAKAAKMKEVDTTIAALCLIGEADAYMASQVVGVACPQGLDAEQCAHFAYAVAERSVPLAKRAATAFEKALEKAGAEGVTEETRVQCRRGLEKTRTLIARAEAVPKPAPLAKKAAPPESGAVFGHGGGARLLASKRFLEEWLRGAVKDAEPELRSCAEGAEGELRLALVVRDGALVSLERLESAVPEAAFRCVDEKLRGLSFPRIEGEIRFEHTLAF